ncbi:hypothetical protein [Thalassospira sp. MCCC 1A01428]|uniref:hypothetical protein n=1 Tax=Thalassospira sp. MCCC 1A01428 TaxID=1470575 RepID=UPI00111C7DE8|nr:hypothetical protein [Thalassospira sp. MCCC 1A01428]
MLDPLKVMVVNAARLSVETVQRVTTLQINNRPGFILSLFDCKGQSEKPLCVCFCGLSHRLIFPVLFFPFHLSPEIEP